MSQAPPVLIGVPDPYDASITGHAIAFDNLQPKGPRLIRYNDAIYAIYRFYTGSAINWRCTKSTDDGATWANLDTADEPSLSTYQYRNDKVFLQGSKVRVISDYITASGANRTHTVRIYTFDLTTEQWDASYVTGPAYTSVGLSHCFQDACLRGLDEIVVCYNETGSANCYAVDIYSTTSATWTTTGLQVFDGSGSFGVVQARTILWDGKYVHFFSDPSLALGDPYFLLHCTLDASNTLGTEQDLFTVWDGAWVDPTAISDGITNYNPLRHPVSQVESACVHGGKIYAFAWGRPTDPYDENNHQILCWHANIGEAAPTFTAEGVYLPVFASSENAAVGPTAFVSNGTLHCAFLQFREDYDTTAIAYVKRLGGTWTSPTDIYTYNTNRPIFDGYEGAASSTPLSGFAPLPDTRNAARFAVMANIEYDSSEAVWYCTESQAVAVGVRY